MAPSDTLAVTDVCVILVNKVRYISAKKSYWVFFQGLRKSYNVYPIKCNP